MLKDEVLSELASRFNVASFVSFSPELGEGVRHYAIPKHVALSKGGDYRSAIHALMRVSNSQSLNVRSFTRANPSGNPFFYGERDPDRVCALVADLASNGYFTIVNETVDINDGGVSGVVHGQLVEFAKGATPRAVETEDHVSMPRSLGFRVLQTVYGFDPHLLAGDDRVEFSLHPLRVGIKGTHVLVWEAESGLLPNESHVSVEWPNSFSRTVGDKAYGLIVADALGFHVPRTTVISRDLAPFTFGSETGTAEIWLRTVPRRRAPGLFTTTRGWCDPFKLLQTEDPAGEHLAAVISQEGIDAKFSGAAASDVGEDVLIEGVPGFGDEFMLGKELPCPLPAFVVEDVREVWRSLAKVLPAPSFEWVHDGVRCWVVQLHSGRLAGHATAGNRSDEEPAGGWLEFDPEAGLDALRSAIREAKSRSQGIWVTRQIGSTSHIGETLRLSGIPTRYQLRRF